MAREDQAKLAGVSKSTFLRWLRELGIRGDRRGGELLKGRPMRSGERTIRRNGHRGCALIISSGYLRQIGLDVGDTVRIDVEEDRIVVSGV